MTLKVTVNVSPSLEKTLGQSRLEISIPVAASLADLLDQLRTTYPAFGEKLDGKGKMGPSTYNYFVNRRAVRPPHLSKRQLQDGDEIHILTPVVGG